MCPTGVGGIVPLLIPVLFAPVVACKPKRFSRTSTSVGEVHGVGAMQGTFVRKRSKPLRTENVVKQSWL